MRRLSALLMGCVLPLACAAPAPTPSLAPAPTQAPASTLAPTQTVSPTQTGRPRSAGWHADIELLVSRMESMHPNFAEQIPIADFEAAARDLSARVPTSTDDQLMVGVMGLVAMVSARGCDAHTGA